MISTRTREIFEYVFTKKSGQISCKKLLLYAILLYYVILMLPDVNQYFNKNISL